MSYTISATIFKAVSITVKLPSEKNLKIHNITTDKSHVPHLSSFCDLLPCSSPWSLLEGLHDLPQSRAQPLTGAWLQGTGMGPADTEPETVNSKSCQILSEMFL